MIYSLLQTFLVLNIVCGFWKKTEKTLLSVCRAFSPCDASHIFFLVSELPDKNQWLTSWPPLESSHTVKRKTLKTVTCVFPSNRQYEQWFDLHNMQECKWQTVNSKLFFMFFFHPAWNPIGGGGVIAGFYLGACSQGKACSHNSETKSHAGGKGFLCFFWNTPG